MGNRAGELDMAHTLTANFRERDLDAALLANDAAMLQALVLTAQALVVLCRAKDASTEQAVSLGLECPIIDGLRLLHFTERPASYHLRRRQADPKRIEIVDVRLTLQHCK